ncbi:MAG: hypothetical protein KGH65_00535 [Candidatus Micrarchaeota archaeon]|nr:hypothetical protein [Candidatus Micrarchaeota archaeon]
MPREKHSHHPILKLAGILIFLAILLALAFVIYDIVLSHAPVAQVAIVTGTIKTIGFSTYPLAASFASPSGTYFTTVVNGRYAISLLAGHSYNMVVSYKSLAGLGSGTCSAGTLSLPLNGTIITYNATC